MARLTDFQKLGENLALFLRADDGGTTASCISLEASSKLLFVQGRLGPKTLLVCSTGVDRRLRMSIFFLKASLEQCYIPSPAAIAGVATSYVVPVCDSRSTSKRSV